MEIGAGKMLKERVLRTPRLRGEVRTDNASGRAPETSLPNQTLATNIPKILRITN
jgi:hypothetical protein